MTGTSGYNVSIACPWCEQKVYGVSPYSIKRARDAAEERFTSHKRECKVKNHAQAKR